MSPALPVHHPPQVIRRKTSISSYAYSSREYSVAPRVSEWRQHMDHSQPFASAIYLSMMDKVMTSHGGVLTGKRMQLCTTTGEVVRRFLAPLSSSSA